MEIIEENGSMEIIILLVKIKYLSEVLKVGHKNFYFYHFRIMLCISQLPHGEEDPKSQRLTIINYILIILHQSCSLAVTLLNIFNPGPSWDSRSYTFWSVNLLWQRKTEMRNGSSPGRLLIFCSEVPSVNFTYIGQNKSHGLM